MMIFMNIQINYMDPILEIHRSLISDSLFSNSNYLELICI
jgi:hypothetical protein